MHATSQHGVERANPGAGGTAWCTLHTPTHVGGDEPGGLQNHAKAVGRTEHTMWRARCRQHAPIRVRKRLRTLDMVHGVARLRGVCEWGGGGSSK